MYVFPLAFSEYTEYDDEAVEGVVDESSNLLNAGFQDDDAAIARRQAWRRHVSEL